jgi:hypothetical protein
MKTVGTVVEIIGKIALFSTLGMMASLTLIKYVAIPFWELIK